MPRPEVEVTSIGRPDLLPGNWHFGVTTAKRHPPYVFSGGPGAALVHKVARMPSPTWC